MSFLSFWGGYLGYTPFKMHSRRKSFRETCSLRMAFDREMYLVTRPRLPALTFRMCIVEVLILKHFEYNSRLVMKNHKTVSSVGSTSSEQYVIFISDASTTLENAIPPNPALPPTPKFLSANRKHLPNTSSPLIELCVPSNHRHSFTPSNFLYNYFEW